MLSRLFRRGSRPCVSQGRRPPACFRPELERLDDRRLPSMTLTVTNTNDFGPGSLRQAILDSNNSVGVVDTISFCISGPGPHVITPGIQNGLLTNLGPLPTITDTVVIDGYSQPGAAAATPDTNAVLQIVLDGSRLPLASSGLFITAGKSKVSGLVVGAFSADIELADAGGNTIEGNFLDTNSSGTEGVIGQPDGDVDVQILSGSNNLIGGTTPASRNVIGDGGSGSFGIRIGSPWNTVQGDYIGTDVTGTNRLPSGRPLTAGISIGSGGDNTVIGGTTPGAGNLISGTDLGISVTSASGTVVQGNRIGTDVSGTRALGNGFGNGVGISLSNARGSIIGGTSPGAGNVISGNDLGLDFSGDDSGTGVMGNLIGTDATGSTPVGNGTDGLELEGTGNCTIGGSDPAAGNVIAYSGWSPDGVNPVAGVLITQGTGYSILSNLIFSNVGFLSANLGIDLNGDGVTPTGPNNSQNSPVLSWVANVGGRVSVTGSLHSTPNTSFLVQFFANPALTPNAIGQVEPYQGETFLGSATVTTDASGNTTFWAGPLGTGIPAGQYVTATATSLAPGVGGTPTPRDTSEFSAAVPEQVGAITGRQFHDLNGSGVRDPGEPALAGWTVYLDANNNGVLDPGELTATTDALGDYLFPTAPTGTYTVREVPQKGWLTTDPAAGSYTAPVVAGLGPGGLDFGVCRPGIVVGRVFNDLLNVNGIQDPGEPGLQSRTVFLDLNHDGKPEPGETATTDALGNYRFGNVRPGTYTLRELLPAGWQQSRPVGGSYRVTVTSGLNIAGENFADYQPVSISGQVFWDSNFNHVKDPGETGLSGWVVYLDANINGVLDPGEATATTDSSGHYSFTGLAPGTYLVRELIPAHSFQPIWLQSLPVAGFYSVTLTNGQSAVNEDFGNVPLLAVV
jgi:hypothetical protein